MRVSWLTVVIAALAATVACNVGWVIWSSRHDQAWQTRLNAANAAKEAALAKAVDGREIGKLVRLWALEKKLDEERLAATPGSNDQTMKTFRYILVRPAFGDVWRELSPAEKAVADEVCLGPDGAKTSLSDFLRDPRSLDFIDGMSEGQDIEAQKIEEQFGKWLIGAGLIPRFNEE